MIQKRPSGAFFSLRCLIYKVHAVTGGTLFSITAFISLVNTFFQSFLTWAIRLLSAATYLSYHTQSSLSSTFLNFFKFHAFSNPPGGLPPDSFVRLPPSHRFVKPFFRLFAIFFLFIIRLANNRYYLSTAGKRADARRRPLHDF